MIHGDYEGLDTRIIIQQTQNGWVVQLPYQPEQFDDMDIDYAVPLSRVNQIKEEAKIAKDVYMQDPEMEKIKKRERKKVPLTELKNERVFVFKEFSEVLEFLKHKITAEDNE